MVKHEIDRSTHEIASIANHCYDLQNTEAPIASGSARTDSMVIIPVMRETPLNAVHLKSLLSLRMDGAIILPGMPAFYDKQILMLDFVKVISKAKHLTFEDEA